MDIRTAKSAAALALCALCAFSVASAQPFPCEPVDPCEDDPSFLIFGLFPCTASPIDPCTLSDGVAACAQTCASCAICEEPEIFVPLGATLQFAEIAPGVLSAFVNSAITIAGYQAQVVCEVGGEWHSNCYASYWRRLQLLVSGPCFAPLLFRHPVFSRIRRNQQHRACLYGPGFRLVLGNPRKVSRRVAFR